MFIRGPHIGIILRWPPPPGLHIQPDVCIKNRSNLNYRKLTSLIRIFQVSTGSSGSEKEELYSYTHTRKILEQCMCREYIMFTEYIMSTEYLMIRITRKYRWVRTIYNLIVIKTIYSFYLALSIIIRIIETTYYSVPYECPP